MSRNPNFGVDAAGTFAANLRPSQNPQFCRFQSSADDVDQIVKKVVTARTASSAPISPEFMQLMRVKMIQAFINSKSESATPIELPLPTPPSLDRILLRRAELKSRKLRLFSGEVRAAPPDSVNIWHDPILVTRPPHPSLIAQLMLVRQAFAHVAAQPQARAHSSHSTQ